MASPQSAGESQGTSYAVWRQKGSDMEDRLVAEMNALKAIHQSSLDRLRQDLNHTFNARFLAVSRERPEEYARIADERDKVLRDAEKDLERKQAKLKERQQQERRRHQQFFSQKWTPDSALSQLAPSLYGPSASTLPDPSKTTLEIRGPMSETDKGIPLTQTTSSRNDSIKTTIGVENMAPPRHRQDLKTQPEKLVSCTLRHEQMDGRDRHMFRVKDSRPKRIATDSISHGTTNSNHTIPNMSPQNAKADLQSHQPRRAIKFQDVVNYRRLGHFDKIVEWPRPGCQEYFILFCEEHKIRFKRSAIQAAAKHLASETGHGHQKRNWAVAIGTLGYHIVDCTHDQADEHNRAVDKAYENNYEPTNLPIRRGTGRPWPVISAGSGNVGLPKAPQVEPIQEATERSADGIANPKRFYVYSAQWGKETWPVMILDWHNQAPGGLADTTLMSTGLLKSSKPNCYLYKSSRIVAWAPEFQDGGSQVAQREFPVMFFDTQRSVAWIPASGLSKFNLYQERPLDGMLSRLNRARHFIAQREGYGSWEERETIRRKTGLAPPPFVTKASSPSRATLLEPKLTLQGKSALLPSLEKSASTQSVASESEDEELGRIIAHGGDLTDDEDYTQPHDPNEEGDGDTTMNGMDEFIDDSFTAYQLRQRRGVSPTAGAMNSTTATQTNSTIKRKAQGPDPRTLDGMTSAKRLAVRVSSSRGSALLNMQRQDSAVPSRDELVRVREAPKPGSKVLSRKRQGLSKLDTGKRMDEAKETIHVITPTDDQMCAADDSTCDGVNAFECSDSNRGSIAPPFLSRAPIYQRDGSTTVSQGGQLGVNQACSRPLCRPPNDGLSTDGSGAVSGKLTNPRANSVDSHCLDGTKAQYGEDIRGNGTPAARGQIAALSRDPRSVQQSQPRTVDRTISGNSAPFQETARRPSHPINEVAVSAGAPEGAVTGRSPVSHSSLSPAPILPVRSTSIPAAPTPATTTNSPTLPHSFTGHTSRAPPLLSLVTSKEVTDHGDGQNSLLTPTSIKDSFMRSMTSDGMPGNKACDATSATNQPKALCPVFSPGPSPATKHISLWVSHLEMGDVSWERRSPGEACLELYETPSETIRTRNAVVDITIDPQEVLTYRLEDMDSPQPNQATLTFKNGRIVNLVFDRSQGRMEIKHGRLQARDLVRWIQKRNCNARAQRP